MAYYVEDLKKPNTEYTATRDVRCYPDQQIFLDQVYCWLNERNIEYTWRGHGTSITRNSSTVFLRVSISNEYDATLFMLAWG
jgi:hypothetical protein